MVGVTGSSAAVAVILENFLVLKGPRLDYAGIGIVGFNYQELFLHSVEEENLSGLSLTRL